MARPPLGEIMRFRDRNCTSATCTLTRARIASRAVALAVAWALVAAPTAAQDRPVALKLSTWLPAQHPLNPMLQAWADDIRKESQGTITTTLFPSEQLGKAFDHYDMARDGIADFAYVNPGYQPGRFPIFAAASLPFLFADAKGGSAAIDAWYRAYAPREMKDVHFCFAFAHDPGTLHSRRKIVMPEDLRDLKVRPATGTIGQMVTTLGGTNVQASAPESREMLERGVADAITFPWGSLSLFGIDKVVSYHLDVPLYVTPFVWVMNRDRYNSLSPAQKKVIDGHCSTEWAEKIASPWAEFESAGRTKIAALPGHELTRLSPDQLAAWRHAIAPVVNQWSGDVKRTGLDPAAVLDALKQSLNRYKAAL
jgi:TRAP-type C4-dicarboxylate transport system substrate-binding protein